MKVRIPALAFLTLAIILSASCSAYLGGDLALVNLGFSFGGSRDATARPLSPPQSITVTVEGPGMGTLVKTVGPTVTEVQLSVPAGAARTVTVTMDMPPADPGAVLSFRGSSTVDLAAGSSTSVTVRVVPAETKLLIPDVLNYRIVQINDMTGAGWTTRAQSDFPALMTFMPTDIDLDSLGRIYFTNNASAYGSIHRIDDMTALNADLVPIASNGPGIPCLAVDPLRDWVYYVTGPTGTLRRVRTDGTGDELLPTGTMVLTGTRGIDVDADGVLYFNASYMTQERIVRYDPADGGAFTSINAASIGAETPVVFTFQDVLAKDDYVYISATYKYAGTSQSKVIRLNRNDLTLVGEYGFGPFTSGIPGLAEIPGARRFLAIRNRKFYLTDEWFGASGNSDDIVSFDDFFDSTVARYGSTGSGTNQFNLTSSFVC